MQTSTTTTRVTNNSVEPDGNNEGLQFDLSYAKSIPGVIKCACMIINVLGYICAEVSHQYGGHSFYGFVSTTALWITGILLLIYVFRLNSHVPEITLTIFEVAFCAIFVLLYIIAMFWMLIYGSGAAAFFAFFAIFGYGYYGWTKYSPYFERPVIVVMDRNTNNVV